MIVLRLNYIAAIILLKVVPSIPLPNTPIDEKIDTQWQTILSYGCPICDAFEVQLNSSIFKCNLRLGC